MVQAAPLRPPFPNHTRSPPHPRSHTTAGAHPRVTRGTVRGSFTAPIFAHRHTTAGAHPRVTRGTVRGSFTAPFFTRRSALHATPPPARIPESPAAPSEAASQHLSSPVGPHFTVMTPHARRPPWSKPHPSAPRSPTTPAPLPIPVATPPPARIPESPAAPSEPHHRRRASPSHPRHRPRQLHSTFLRPSVRTSRHTTAGAHPRINRGTVRGSFTAPFFARRSALHGDDSACAPVRSGVGRTANSTRLET
eukprot:jgi/Tetstr1/442617/TSEL_030713.t1